MAKLSDTTLVAYVDGELDSSATRDIDEALAADAEARDRVNRLRQSTLLIRSLFEQDEARPISPKLRRLLERPPARNYRQYAMAMAASVMIVAVGFGGGWLAGESHAGPERSFDARLFDEIADYHTTYAMEDEHQVEVGADRQDHIEDWLGNRLHRRLHIPDLSNRDLTFAGARLLSVDGAPVAELVYHWPNDPHKPLALCITFGDPGDRGLKTDARDGVQQVMWRANGYTYVLVGWTTPQTLNSIAADLMPRLRSDT